jgi:hypothetical protein
MPLAENLSLVISEEPEGETELRKSLCLFTRQEDIQQTVDVEMEESNYPAAPFAQHPETVLSAANPTPPKSVPPPAQPVSVPSLRSHGNSTTQNEKFTGHPEPGLERRELLEEHLPTLFRSSIIEAPKTRPSQSTSNISQVISGSTSTSAPNPPVFGVPAIGAEDEDEDMPAIDLNSDSDLE